MSDEQTAVERQLTTDQRKQWDESGFLVLPGFIDAAKIDAANQEVASLVGNSGVQYPNVSVDILNGELAGRRMKVTDVPASAYLGPVKINDLYLDSEVMRKLNLDRDLLLILAELLEGDPLLINSLNFLFGSQQSPHFDTWFMPPPVENKMVVASICLEDMTDANGPLIFYPGSHKLPAYHFSHGHIHAVHAEMDACMSHVNREIESADIKEMRFYGKTGDVFIWHAQLFHGGAPIIDMSKTRRSLVTHFWRRQDVGAERVNDLGSKRYVLKKEHLEAA